jgi:hypothetical protein
MGTGSNLPAVYQSSLPAAYAPDYGDGYLGARTRRTPAGRGEGAAFHRAWPWLWPAIPSLLGSGLPLWCGRMWHAHGGHGPLSAAIGIAGLGAGLFLAAKVRGSATAQLAAAGAGALVGGLALAAFTSTQYPADGLGALAAGCLYGAITYGRAHAGQELAIARVEVEAEQVRGGANVQSTAIRADADVRIAEVREAGKNHRAEVRAAVALKLGYDPDALGPGFRSSWDLHDADRARLLGHSPELTAALDSLGSTRVRAQFAPAAQLPADAALPQNTDAPTAGNYL